MLDGVVRQLDVRHLGDVVEAVGRQVLDGVLLQVEVVERPEAAEERALHGRQVVVVQVQDLRNRERLFSLRL